MDTVLKSRVIVAFLLFGSCIAFAMPDMAMRPAHAQTKEKRQLKSLEKEIRERDEKRETREL